MNEAAVNAMSDALVAGGHLTREQVTQGRAAEQVAEAPSGTPSHVTPSGSVDIASRAAELVRTGQMTQEQADAALAQYNAVPSPDAEGNPTAKTAAPPAPLAASGAASPWEGVELPEGFGPPPKATDYRLDALVTQNLSIDQLRNVGETLHAAKLPTPIATQLVAEIASVAAQNLDEKGLQMMNQRSMAQLRAVYGDATEAKIKSARAFVDQLEKVRPGVLRMLEDSGAGSSPIVIRQLVEHAERLANARGKK